MFCLALFLLFEAVVEGTSTCPDGYSTYRGCVNHAHNGEECVNWEEVDMWGDEEFIERQAAQRNGVGDHNYCRNPDSLRYGPWCYSRKNDGTIGKVYCPVTSTAGNCIFTSPEMDPSCPPTIRTKAGEAKKRRLPPNADSPQPNADSPQPNADSPQPNADSSATVKPSSSEGEFKEGRWLFLNCHNSCPGATWTSGPTLNSAIRLKNGSLLLQEEDAGVWYCSCGGTAYTRTVAVLTGSGTADQPDNNTDDVPDNNTDGDRQEQEKDDEEEEGAQKQGKAEARVDGEDTTKCTGVNCGLCKKNPVICGVLVFCVVAMTIVLAIYVRQTFRWHRVEDRLKYSLFHSLPRNGTVTAPQNGVVEASLNPKKNYPKESHYAEALKLKRMPELIQAKELPDNATFSTRATILHPTTTLPTTLLPNRHGQLPENATFSTSTLHPERRGLSRIRSYEIASRDDIICRSQDVSEAEFESNLIVLSPVLTLQGEEDLEERRGRGDSVAQRSDVTVFDKYYDTDVDNWSIEEETQI